MDKQTKEIIKLIAELQCEALTNIMENPETMDHQELLRLLQIDNDEIVDAAQNVYNFYLEVMENPALIRMATEYQVMICQHILYRMEEQWITSNPDGVRGAWEVIHSVVDRYHPEFKLMIWK